MDIPLLLSVHLCSRSVQKPREIQVNWITHAIGSSLLIKLLLNTLMAFIEGKAKKSMRCDICRWMPQNSPMFTFETMFSLNTIFIFHTASFLVSDTIIIIHTISKKKK